MKLAMNHATLMKTPLETFLKAIAQAGFQGVELRRDKTLKYLEDHSVSELNDLLKTLSLECIAINAIELFSLCPEREFKRILKYTKKLMNIGNQIGCNLIIAVPSFLKDKSMTTEMIKQKTLTRLKILTEIAEDHNFKLAFEPLGFPACSIRKLNVAWDIIKDKDLPEMGLVIDTFHYFVAEHSIKDLEEIKVDDLWIVHINDAIEKSLNLLKDSDRILPGMGFFELHDFLKKLKDKGYKKWLSLELFNESFWKKDPFDAAEASYKSLQKII
ncbi:MAG: sugar phosphate isomerase/epimerase family protein [Promethearchaeia archaeon]